MFTYTRKLDNFVHFYNNQFMLAISTEVVTSIIILIIPNSKL